MVELEIISSAAYGSSDVSAEFKVYSEINNNGIEPSGKLILEPVNAANKNVKIFLSQREYSGCILTNLNRKPITADNPVEIPLYYDKNDDSFYLEDNCIVNEILIITGLICYDLGIGIYQAMPDNYEINASYKEMQNPDNQFTDFSEIDTIFLSKDELAKIKDYHVIYKIANNGTTDVELIKYQRVNPKAAIPESIKGILEENGFDCIELVADGGDVNE